MTLILITQNTQSISDSDSAKKSKFYRGIPQHPTGQQLMKNVISGAHYLPIFYLYIS